MTEWWTEDTLRGIEVEGDRAGALTDLARPQLTRTFASTGSHSDWPLVGFAMLSRACGTLESVMDLSPKRRAGDAAVLVRTLFEEVVTFAWIAIDPDTNAEAWVRWDRAQRIKADNDPRDVGAPPLLEPNVREEFAAHVRDGPVMPDNLADRARQADQHWAQHIDAIDDDAASASTFRGMYRYIYRGDSQHAHAAVASLDALIINAGEPGQMQVLLDETDPGENNPFTRAPTLLALGLLVAQHALDLPGMDAAIDDIFARHRDE